MILLYRLDLGNPSAHGSRGESAAQYTGGDVTHYVLDQDERIIQGSNMGHRRMTPCETFLSCFKTHGLTTTTNRTTDQPRGIAISIIRANTQDLRSKFLPVLLALLRSSTVPRPCMILPSGSVPLVRGNFMQFSYLFITSESLSPKVAPEPRYVSGRPRKGSNSTGEHLRSRIDLESTPTV